MGGGGSVLFSLSLGSVTSPPRLHPDDAAPWIQQRATYETRYTGRHGGKKSIKPPPRPPSNPFSNHFPTSNRSAEADS